MDKALMDERSDAIRSASVHALEGKASCQSKRRCEYHDDIESPFHRAFHLGFRCSTMLPSAAMHGDVGYLCGCHEMGKRRASYHRTKQAGATKS